MAVQLKLGDSGDDVVTLQTTLVGAGIAEGTPTGQFDTITQQAVMEVQRRASLPQTGVVDDATWGALLAMLPPEDPTVNPNAGGELQPPVDIQGKAPPMGLLLAVGLGFGALYYFSQKHKASQTAEYDEDDGDDEYEDDDEDEDSDEFEEDDGPGERLEDYDDVVTDRLLDEPAAVAASGRAGDCKKAARLLLNRSGLARTEHERGIYNRVVRKVASDCRGAEDAVAEVIEEEVRRREEIDREVGHKLIRSAHDTAKMPEQGFRKSKKKLTRKTTGSDESEPGVRGRGRRGASAMEVRKKSGERYALRKKKAKTKRGYTWHRA